MSAWKNLFRGLFGTSLKRIRKFAIAILPSANRVENDRGADGRRGQGNTVALKPAIPHAVTIPIDYFLATACCGDTAGIEELLNKGAPVNGMNIHGLTALMMASQNGHKAAVQLLLDKGADVHAKDKDGDTALKIATQYGPHPEVQALLIQAGAR